MIPGRKLDSVLHRSCPECGKTPKSIRQVITTGQQFGQPFGVLRTIPPHVSGFQWNPCGHQANPGRPISWNAADGERCGLWVPEGENIAAYVARWVKLREAL